MAAATQHPALVHLQAEDTDRKPFANDIQVLFKPLHASRMLKDRTRRHRIAMPLRLAATGINTLSTFTALRSATLRAPRAQCSIHSVERLDERFDAYFEQAATAFDFIYMRDREFMDWRFLDPRGGNFTVRLAETDGQVLGHSVLKATGARGYIVDLLALPGREDVVRALLDDALRQLRARDVAAVHAWMVKNHPYMRELRRLGFVNSRHETGLTLRPQLMPQSEIEFLWNDPHARVHFTHADSDLV